MKGMSAYNFFFSNKSADGPDTDYAVELTRDEVVDKTDVEVCGAAEMILIIREDLSKAEALALVDQLREQVEEAM